MIRIGAIGAVFLSVGLAAADEPAGDRHLIQQAAGQSRATGASLAATDEPAVAVEQAPAGELSAEERAARVEASLSLAKLELVLGRKLLRVGNHEAAARKAKRALSLLSVVPCGPETEAYELQAEGILSRAARAGVDVDALADDGGRGIPPPDDASRFDQRVEAAGRVSRQYTGPARADVESTGDTRVIGERTVRQQTPDGYGYRPGRAIFDVDRVLAIDEQRTHYQGALRTAVKADEVRALVEVDEARLLPDGDVSYPPDWPQRVKKREQWSGGAIARSGSWYDREGREWYVAVYDIRDITYVPPDFEREWKTPRQQRRDWLDRREFWRQGYLFWGPGYGSCGPSGCGSHGGLPLLHYFGGLDAIAARGPKYSPELQRQVVEMIKAFTNTPDENITPLPAVVPGYMPQ